MLSGTLANGASVVLLDASLDYWSMGHGYVSGSAALLGNGSAFFGWSPTKTPAEMTNETPLISSVKFQVAGLDAILGSAPIKSVKSPGTHPDNPKDLWSANLDLEATCEWEADGITLSVGYDGQMRAADAYEFRLTFSPVAIVSLSKSVPLRVDDIVEPLHRIISLATGTSQDLTYVSVELRRAARQVPSVRYRDHPRSVRKLVREAEEGEECGARQA